MPAELSRYGNRQSYVCQFIEVVDCKRFFSCPEDRMTHYMEEADHEFCPKCMVACLDWEDLIKHKIQTGCTITCPQCGIDFKSIGGRNAHIRQLHPKEQRLVCPGCGTVFARGGPFIEHLENGRCNNARDPANSIHKNEFQEHVNHKAIVDKILNPEKAAQRNVIVNSMSSMDDLEGSPAKDVSSDAVATPDPRGRDRLRMNTGESGNMFKQKFWHASSDAFDAERHFNRQNQRYECPMSGCRYSTQVPGDFREHCLIDHVLKSFRCPECQKEFKSLTAITQHWESPSVRCKARKKDYFAELVKRATGGFLDVNDVSNNGEVTFATTRPAAWEG